MRARSYLAGPLAVVAILAGTATAGASPVRPASASPPADYHGCRAGYLCIWTGYGFTGDRWEFWDCRRETLPLWVPVHSWANQQYGGAVSTFYDASGRKIKSYAAVNHDGDSDPEGLAYTNSIQIC